ncbi:hypothetical protein SLE2022_105520 [Rubroshorea leprosula]
MEITLQRFLILIAFSLCLHLNVGSVRSLCLEDQQLSLIKFKQTLIFDPASSFKLVSWNSSTDCCSWSGVKCSNSGHVIDVDLGLESISGGIDNSSSLLNLHHLQGLNLAKNFFRGEFPAKVFQLPTLQNLDISYNAFLQGSLPEFPENGSLQTPLLRETNFSGMMPDSIRNLRMLSTMDLSRCHFRGSIPNSTGSLANLVVLDLSQNQFSGSIPSFGMLKNLNDLDLSHNDLSGQISSTNWENLSNLANLRLQNNSLEGIIPLSLFSLPSLQTIDLSNNWFSGQIVDFAVLYCSQLVLLNLRGNRLEGSIPISFFKLQGLVEVDLSSNNFNGTLELSIIQKLENISTLDLSFNHLSVDDALFRNINFTSFPQLLELRLASCKLRKFPSFLKNQSNMLVLDLSSNQIQGEIPNWISKLPLRWLNLSNNSLTKVDGSFCNFSSLPILDLHSNQLQGDISNVLSLALYMDYSENRFSSVLPADIGHFLFNTYFFSISGNYFRGVIPNSICNGEQLNVLDLSQNSLSGTVPRCLIAMSHSNGLGVLNLRRNDLTGTIPDVFSVNCGLQTLYLNENYLQGKIPKSLANCKVLEVLDVVNNGINDSFPCWLSTISSLRVLVLRSNKFYGSIECPTSNETWPLLQIVDLSSNKFSGKLPTKFFETWTTMMVNKDKIQLAFDYLRFDISLYSLYYQDMVIVTNKGSEIELVKILTIFTSIDFSCNKFEGKIPEVMREFRALIVLNLSHNSLMGPIPPSLGNLQHLESLDLSANNLRGNIPQQLGGLNFLEVLNLSHNQLEGRIPKGNQLQTFSEDSFKDNKGLCGTPLRDCGANMQLPSTAPTSKGNNLDNGTKIDWNLISAEVGFIFGLAIVILPLMLMKRWRIWYYKHVDSVLFKIFPQLDQRSRNHERRTLRTRQRRN